jgi:hypothetical protein
MQTIPAAPQVQHRSGSRSIDISRPPHARPRHNPDTSSEEHAGLASVAGYTKITASRRQLAQERIEQAGL